MQQRRLGELEVSAVGLGCATMTPFYDAPDPEAIRRAAQRNSLPVDRIIEVSVLDPYFYK